MELDPTTRLNRWVKSAAANTVHSGRLAIGPRLILGFVFIILSMLAADAIILWQFSVVRTQAMRLNDIDQKLVAVLRVHTSLLAFHDQLEGLADAEDADRLLVAGGPLRTAVLEDIRRATSALSLAPSDPRRDPTVLPTLHVIQSALPSQLEAIITLAASGDWRAVHLRLANQVRPLEYLASALVQKVEREASEQQAETVLNIRRVRRLVFWVVPLTAVFTLLIAATLGLAITRSITQPLARLVEGSKALARGEFQHQVSVTGKDELAHLGHVFNDTARRLQDLYETLQQSEAYLAEAQRLSKTGSFGWSVSTGEVRWSEETFRIFQYDRTTKPTVELILKRVHPEDTVHVKHTIENASTNGKDFEDEYRLLMPDNSIKYVHVVAHTLSDKSGEIVLGAVMDVTDRKRAEEALREAQANLARVSRVTTIGELTASLAHEVNQPIAAAVTSANSCIHWLADDIPNVDKARAAAMRIAKDGTRAAEIISRIRFLFQKGTPQWQLVDVNEIIGEMIVLLRGEATRYSISVRTELVADLPQVMGDRVQLQQVLMNLMINSIDAMKDVDGTRELAINSQRAKNEEVMVSVTDTGVGLPPQHAEQIFNAFFTTKPHGTGMGLRICRSIVESHGGRLWAANNPPRGASFYFALPTKVEAE
jgi:signal transduction histidine kinase/HAMP domain-containing protein